MPPTPPTRLTTAGIPGRSLHGLKAGGDGGTDTKINSSSQQDEDYMQVFKQRIETLQLDLSRRQESYIRRERAFNMRIKELEEEIGSLKAGKMAWMEGDRGMESLKTMHQQILHNVKMVQSRSCKILQEQETDLLRAFRARLFDVQTELEREKSRKGGNDSTWIERMRTTETELDRANEMADRLGRLNHGLSKENMRLKSHFKSQEEDRIFLVKQLVAVKKENQSLRQEREAMEASIVEIQQNTLLASDGVAAASKLRQQRSSVLPAPYLPGLASSPRQAGADTDKRYKEIINRSKRLLETERRNLRQVRSAYTAELQQRTELENMLRAAVAEVRQAVAAKQKKERGKPGTSENREGDMARAETLSPTPSPGARHGDMGAEDSPALFSAREREQTLEMLLSRERVLSLLYSKTFPLTSTTTPRHAQPVEADDSNHVVIGADGDASQAA